MRTIIPDIKTAALEQMSEVKAWICWKPEKRGNKISKVPYDLTGKYKRAITKPENLYTYDEVVEAVKTDAFKDGGGIGFVFNHENGYCGIDFDDCRDPDKQVLDDPIFQHVKFLDSYTEISPSGTGLHTIIKANFGGGARGDLNNKAGKCEIYDNGRFFTVTGWHLPETPEDIHDRQYQLDQFVEKHFKKPESKRVNEELKSDFIFREDLNPPAGKFQALYNNDGEFQQTWNRKRKNLNDPSPSGYEFQLVRFGILAKWEPAEIFALVVAWRREHDCLEKYENGRANYLFKAVYGNAYKTVEHLISDCSYEEAQLSIKDKTGVFLDKIIQMGKPPSIYYLVIDNVRIKIGEASALLSQVKFQQIVFDHAKKVPKQLSRKEWYEAIKEFPKITEEVFSIPVDLQSGIKENVLHYLEGNGFDEEKIYDWKKQAIGKQPFIKDSQIFINFEDYKTHLYNHCNVKDEARAIKIQLADVGFKADKVYFRKDNKSFARGYWRIPEEKFFNEEFIPSVRTARDREDEIPDSEGGEGSAGIRKYGGDDMQPDENSGAGNQLQGENDTA